MRRAFLVLGPESSGTRLATKILISAANCAGSDDHEQLWDRERPTMELIVWRRSVPHGGYPLDLSTLLNNLVGYRTTALVCVRDPDAVVRSQLWWGHALTVDEARSRIRTAYESIFVQLSMYTETLSWELVVYESLVLHPEKAQVDLLRRLNLGQVGPLVAVRDENNKWRRAEKS